jgi:hypothetical protein
VTAFAIVERSQQDPFVQVDRRPRDRQGAEKTKHSGAAAYLRRARRAALDMGG